MMKIAILVALFATMAFANPQDIVENLPRQGTSNSGQASVALPDMQKQYRDKVEATSKKVTEAKAKVVETNKKLDGLEMLYNNQSKDLDTMWYMLGSALVFLLTIGFGLIEGAQARKGSRGQIFLKNILIAALVAIIWWAVGYGIAFAAISDNATTGQANSAGDSNEVTQGQTSGQEGHDDVGTNTNNAFIGNGYVFLSYKGMDQREFALWTYHYSLALFATIIATSALTDRGSLSGYFFSTIMFAGGVYPIAAHWVWAKNGWLNVGSNNSIGSTGMIDFAGSGVIGCASAGFALVTTFFAGPRIKRFDAGFNKANPGAFASGNKVYMGLGAIFLWVGWYGLTFVMAQLSAGRAVLAAKLTINTTLAAAAGAIFGFIADNYLGAETLDVRVLAENPEIEDPRIKRTDMRITLNGVIAGLLAVSSGISTYEPWAAFTVGAFGGLIAFFGPRVLVLLSIDDPCETFSLFGLAGFWGCAATGWFARSANVDSAFGATGLTYGIWYGGSAELWGINMFGATCMFFLGVVFALIMCIVLRIFNLLRVSVEQEARGITFPFVSDEEMKQKQH